MELSPFISISTPWHTADDQVHQQTWLTLRQLAQDVRFLLRRRLPVGQQRKHAIHRQEQHGTFLTILPQVAHKEMDDFEDYAKAAPHPLAGSASRPPSHDARTAPDSVYHGWESPNLFQEGFRVLWYRSSPKIASGPETQRSERTGAAAPLQLKQLQQRANGNTTVATLEEASDKILKQYQVEAFLQVTPHLRNGYAKG